MAKFSFAKHWKEFWTERMNLSFLIWSMFYVKLFDYITRVNWFESDVNCKHLLLYFILIRNNKEQMLCFFQSIPFLNCLRLWMFGLYFKVNLSMTVWFLKMLRQYFKDHVSWRYRLILFSFISVGSQSAISKCKTPFNERHSLVFSLNLILSNLK